MNNKYLIFDPFGVVSQQKYYCPICKNELVFDYFTMIYECLGCFSEFEKDLIAGSKIKYEDLH